MKSDPPNYTYRQAWFSPSSGRCVLIASGFYSTCIVVPAVQVSKECKQCNEPRAAIEFPEQEHLSTPIGSPSFDLPFPFGKLNTLRRSLGGAMIPPLVFPVVHGETCDEHHAKTFGLEFALVRNGSPSFLVLGVRTNCLILHCSCRR